jgi:hypothetical protein
MSLETELQGIIRENEGDLVAFARKIYEHGYRQGLASRPDAVSTLPQAPMAAQIEPHSAGHLTPLFPARTHAVVADKDAEADDQVEDEEPVVEGQSCDHRVRASISVAGLQRKIERLFDLSRFDIEVVICRKGDPERRRLRGAVRLGTYLSESE